MAADTPEKTMVQLWQALSHAPNTKPNISKLKRLLHPQAVIYGAKATAKESKLNIKSADEFITVLDKISKTGFYECEVVREIKIYDKFAHIYSVVETRYKRGQASPDFVGANSVQLFKSNNTWQVVSLYYYIENPDSPIPLAGGKSGVCLG